MPETCQASDFGRITRYAALHHLARVYLTLKRDDGDLQKALSCAEQVIRSGNYSLVESHAELWDINNKQNPETLFSVLYSQNAELNGNGNTAHMYFCSAYSEEHPAVKRVIEYGRPWSRERSTDYAIRLFDPDIDRRWEDWTQAVDSSILYPVYPWEGECIEAASIARRGNVLYIFYAGAYNNAPQQIGVACSRDGLTWKRLFDTPFLPNGRPDVSLLSGK